MLRIRSQQRLLAAAKQAQQQQQQQQVSRFHTTSIAQGFTKGKSGVSEKSSVFKRGTPNKSKGWIGSFKETSAYSKLGKAAPRPKGISNFTPRNMHYGAITQYPSHVAGALAAFGSFKLGQRHELFREKTTLVRETTTKPVLDLIEKGTSSSSGKNTMCLMGDPGVGKSTLVAQAQAMAVMNNYIVLPVPRARELVDGTNDVVWNDTMKHFSQPMYTRQWLKRIANGNEKLLKKMPLNKGIKAAVNITSMYEYIMGMKNSTKDVDQVLENVVETLRQSNTPVLFTLDDFNMFTDKVFSDHWDTNARQIYHGQLAIPKLFLQFLSGEREFKKGAVIASLSSANRINDTITAGLGFHDPVPYSNMQRYDAKLASKLKNVKPLQVPRYDQNETKTSVNYWQSVGIIAPEHVKDESAFVGQKYLVSGNGNPRSLLEACTRLY